jgi:hypothetical protein
MLKYLFFFKKKKMKIKGKQVQERHIVWEQAWSLTTLVIKVRMN